MSVRTFRLGLEGVSCNGCVNKIRQALLKDDPDSEIGVDLGNKIATIQTMLSLTTVKQQIAELGYQANEIVPPPPR
ncbi:MAG: heavy metal-associated domain-containing protein [Motiliproteus sp.]